MLGSLVKALMGVVSLGFLVVSLVMLYKGAGLWGFILVLLIGGGVVYVLIFVIGTPEPEGGWWIVKTELESNLPVADEACFHIRVEPNEADPLVAIDLGQKARYLLERQMHRTGQGKGCDYELRIKAGAVSLDAWEARRGGVDAKKPKAGFMHYLLMEAWQGDQMHWGVTASLERDGLDLNPQLNALLAAAFDCFGRAEQKDVKEVPTREHEYVRLLQEEFSEA
jgi:hypothetical protein